MNGQLERWCSKGCNKSDTIGLSMAGLHMEEHHTHEPANGLIQKVLNRKDLKDKNLDMPLGRTLTVLHTTPWQCNLTESPSSQQDVADK